MMDVKEEIVHFIYNQLGYKTPWDLLDDDDKRFWRNYFFEVNIGRLKFKSGSTVKELFDREEENYAKREALRKL